jgi:hypothetical protein
VYKILSLSHVNEYDIEFEKEILQILKSVNFLSSNMSNASDLNKISNSERDTIKMISGIVTRFRKFSSSNEEQNIRCEKLIGKSRGIFISFLFKISTLIGKKFYFDFRDERRKHKIIKKNIEKKTNKPQPFYPFSDNFIKSRLSLHIVELYIKKLFSMSLFGDGKILDKKESFMTIIDGMDEKFKSAELIIAMMNTFSFKLIFDEICTIFGFINNNEYKYNLKKTNLLKSYLTFIAYNKYSTVYKDYDFKNLYSKYFDALLNKVEDFIKK